MHPSTAEASRLLLWFSPSFPTGAFGYSHGLEWAVEAGDVTDQESLAEWIAAILEHGGGWSDAVVACPPAAFSIVAIDRSAESWFGFREPVEIGWLSLQAEWLIGISREMLLVALALAFFAARGTPGFEAPASAAAAANDVATEAAIQ